MTFAELKAETFRRLHESATAPVFWTAADVGDALNAGYAELSDASEWFEEYVDIDLLQDRPYYDLRALVGSGFLALRAAFDVQTNRWLLPTTARQFDAHDRRWEQVTGEPQRALLRGLWWVGYWPRIQSETGLIKQHYTALPAALVTDADEPGFPETFHTGCIEFALTDLWAQDGETARALAAWDEYVTTETALTAWVTGRAADPMAHGFGMGSVPR